MYGDCGQQLDVPTRLGIVREGLSELAGAPVHDGQQFIRVGLRAQLFQALGGE